MKNRWQNLTARYDALQLRERWLVAAAALGGLVLVGFSLFVEPSLRRGQLATRSIAEQQTQLTSVRAQVLTLQSPSRDPDVAARAELGVLKTQLAALATRLSVLEGTLVPPQKMTNLLEDMVGQRSGLRLLSLRTLPVAPLLEKKPASGEKDTNKEAYKDSNAPKGAASESVAGAEKAGISEGLFKHGVEIRIEGSYPELVAYLERLEQSQLKLLWSNVALSADKHPKLVLTLTVYTLSMDRAWLVV